MRSLYLRIYLTLVLLLLVFGFGSTWLFQRQIEQERGNAEAQAPERLNAMVQLIHLALPPASAPRAEQAAALQDWGQRLRMAIALNDADGKRIAASERYEQRETEAGVRSIHMQMADGRSLAMIRFPRQQPGFGQISSEGGREGGPTGMRPRGPRRDDSPWQMLTEPQNGQWLLIFLVLLFLGVAAGAYPVVRRLTRRLEELKRGVEQFGAGQLAHRVDQKGNDEVAALAASFNLAAAQIETLLRSQQSMLANASHELRSPLARLKMAVAMIDAAGPAQRARLATEIDTNIAELDALVEEVLLASRLDADAQLAAEEVDLLGMAVEEAARAGAEFESMPGLTRMTVIGEDRLLRRALRNLLDNACRYGGSQVRLELQPVGRMAELRVCDRGPGVPAAMHERIFDAFFRLPGHAEQAGGIGLGLSLVRQIALRHGGQVRCEARPGGGSMFVLSLPAG